MNTSKKATSKRARNDVQECSPTGSSIEIPTTAKNPPKQGEIKKEIRQIEKELKSFYSREKELFKRLQELNTSEQKGKPRMINRNDFGAMTIEDRLSLYHERYDFKILENKGFEDIIRQQIENIASLQKLIDDAGLQVESKEDIRSQLEEAMGINASEQVLPAMNQKNHCDSCNIEHDRYQIKMLENDQFQDIIREQNETNAYLSKCLADAGLQKRPSEENADTRQQENIDNEYCIIETSDDNSVNGHEKKPKKSEQPGKSGKKVCAMSKGELQENSESEKKKKDKVSAQDTLEEQEELRAAQKSKKERHEILNNLKQTNAEEKDIRNNESETKNKPQELQVKNDSKITTEKNLENLQEIKVKTEELDTKTQEKEQTDEELENLQKAIDFQNQEIKLKTEELDTKTQKKEQTDKELTSLKQEIDLRENEIKSNELALAQKKEELNQISVKISSLQEREFEYAKDIEQKNDTVKAFEKNKEDNLSRIADLEDEIEKYKTIHIRTSSEIMAKVRNISDLQNKNAEQKKKEQELKEDMKNLKREHQSLLENCNDLERVKKFEVILTKYEQENNQLVEERDALKKNIEEHRQVKLFQANAITDHGEPSKTYLDLVLDGLKADDYTLDIAQVPTQKHDNPDAPVIVFCVNTSRLGTDIDATYDKLKLTGCKSTVLVVFHHIKVNNTSKVTPSGSVLSQGTVSRNKITEVIDCAFWSKEGLHDCDLNTTAVKKLKVYLKRSLISE